MDLIFLILSTLLKCVPCKFRQLKPRVFVVVLVMSAELFKDFLELFKCGLIFSFSFSLFFWEGSGGWGGVGYGNIDP